jgi:hypothetical protein
VPSQPKQHQEQWEGGEPKGIKKKKKKPVTLSILILLIYGLWAAG